MDFRGTIVSTRDLAGIDQDEWKRLINGHVNLAPAAAKVGINPFTRGRFTYRPDPATACVVRDGKEIGMMSWAEDGTSQIAVWGISAATDDVAVEVAIRLGAEFRPSQSAA